MRGVTRRNNERGGKWRSSKTCKGNRGRKILLEEAAWAAKHTKDTYLAVLHHRLASRRGKKKAIVAVAHALLVILYHVIVRNEPYQDLGADCFDKQTQRPPSNDWSSGLRNWAIKSRFNHPLP